MNIQIETVYRSIMDFDDLIQGYYKDTNAQDGIPPLVMRWDFFARLEREDKLVVFTARENEELLGFNMYMLANHPQHDYALCAHCNTLAVATKHRGKKIGTLLTEAALAHFKDKTDIKMVFHSFRTIYDAVPLFPKLGFDLVEHVYMKVL